MSLHSPTIFSDGEKISNPTSGAEYVIEKFLDEGGMGQTYIGKTQNGQKAIVKTVLLQNDSYDKDRIQRLKFEADVLRLFDTDYVVRCIDFFEIPQTPVLVLEFLEGSDLEKYAMGSGLEEEEAKEITGKILQAVDVMHRKGVLHRDLKPQNVFYNPSNQRVTLIDFGLARQYNKGVDIRQLQQASMTFATPGYAPPEVTGSNQFLWSVAGEIYAVGAILYFLLTGIHPTLGDKSPKGLNPHFKRSDISTETAKIVMKATHPDINKRFQTANDFYKVLTGQKLEVPQFPYFIVNGSKFEITKDLTKEEFIIGRSSSCDLVIDDPYPASPAISRQHAKVTAKEIGGQVRYRIEEYKPNTNGVYILSKQSGVWVRAEMDKPKFINTGDIVALGYHEWFGPYLTMSFIDPLEMKAKAMAKSRKP